MPCKAYVVLLVLATIALLGCGAPALHGGGDMAGGFGYGVGYAVGKAARGLFNRPQYGPQAESFRFQKDNTTPQASSPGSIHSHAIPVRTCEVPTGEEHAPASGRQCEDALTISSVKPIERNGTGDVSCPLENVW